MKDVFIRGKIEFLFFIENGINIFIIIYIKKKYFKVYNIFIKKLKGEKWFYNIFLIFELNF